MILLKTIIVWSLFYWKHDEFFSKVAKAWPVIVGWYFNYEIETRAKGMHDRFLAMWICTRGSSVILYISEWIAGIRHLAARLNGFVTFGIYISTCTPLRLWVKGNILNFKRLWPASQMWKLANVMYFLIINM